MAKRKPQPKNLRDKIETLRHYYLPGCEDPYSLIGTLVELEDVLRLVDEAEKKND